MLTTKNKLNVFIIIFLILSLLITAYIFSNSFEKPEQSNIKSNTVSDRIQPVVDPQFKIEKNDFQMYTRKAAHIIEFSLLGLCIGGLFASIYYKTKRTFFSLPILLCLSVAVCDEFIQSFNGRTSSVMDVLIDSSGSIGGLLIVLVAVLIFNKLKNRNRVFF